MKKIFNFCLVNLYIIVLLVACKGKDGDPGPQGDPGAPGTSISDAVKRGSFEGTATGTRKDGVAFTEAFKYEYATDTIEGFTTIGSTKYITFSRSNGGDHNSIVMGLKSVLDGGLVPSGYGISFYFSKEIDQNNLFSFSAIPYFSATKGFLMEISFEQNKTYSFYTTGQGIYYFSNSISLGNVSQSVYQFSTNTNYYVYYSKSTGALVAISDGSSDLQTSGAIFDLYNKLSFKQNASLGKPVFYSVDKNTPLFEQIPDVPADQLNITNYNFNSASGVVSFDFELKISGYVFSYNRKNTTGHDLSIKGKFNSGKKIYKSISGRIAG